MDSSCDGEDALVVYPNKSIYSGPFSSKTRTHSGFRVDVCKSCIQKYVRRGMIAKAFYFVYELYLFKFVERRVHSNLVNRLKCIISEDIGIADNLGVLSFSRLLESEYDLKDLFVLVVKMCESKKTRIISHINSFYDQRGLSNKKRSFPEYFNISYAECIGSLDLDTFVKVFSTFQINKETSRIDDKKLNAFLKSQTKLSDDQKLLLLRYKNSSQKEKFVYLFHALLLFYKGIQPAQRFQLTDAHWKIFYGTIRKVKSGELEDIDDFCLDKHTRGSTKTTKDFALEGALVDNEDMNCRIPVFYDNYIRVRSGVTHDTFQAQLITSRHKKKVFVYPEIVMKGPYNDSESKLLNTLDRTTALLDLENTLDLPPCLRSALPIKEVVDKDDGKWVLWDNVGNFYNAVVENQTSKLEQNVSIAKRGSFVKRVSELIQHKTLDQIENDPVLSSAIRASLQHLYCRSVIGCHDNCLENILLIENHPSSISSEQVVVGIDLEEKGTPPTTMFKKPTKLSKDLLRRFGDCIKRLPEDD